MNYKKLINTLRDLAEDLELESDKLAEMGEFSASDIIKLTARQLNDRADELSGLEN